MMNIRYFGYNAFLISSGDHKIAIDPGATFLYFLRLKTLIPKSEWSGVSHIFVTHGDPDHYWHLDRLAEASGAAVILNRTMVREGYALGPRDRGLAFTTSLKRLHTISVGETIDVDEMSITGIRATHGPLKIRIGPFERVLYPGPDERIGWGAIGYSIVFGGINILNLGDTLPHPDEWASLRAPDLLMVPIGGAAIHNTMDEDEALHAVDVIRPAHVIPCHYNCPAFFTRKYNPADEIRFKREVEKLDIQCHILHYGDDIDIQGRVS